MAGKQINELVSNNGFAQTPVQPFVVIALGILDHGFFIHGMKIDDGQRLFDWFLFLRQSDRVVSRFICLSTFHCLFCDPCIGICQEPLGDSGSYIPDLPGLPFQPDAIDAVRLDASTYVFHLLHIRTPKMIKGGPLLPGHPFLNAAYLIPIPSPLTIAVTLPETNVAAVPVSVKVRNTGFSNLMGWNASDVRPVVLRKVLPADAK